MCYFFFEENLYDNCTAYKVTGFCWKCTLDFLMISILNFLSFFFQIFLFFAANLMGPAIEIDPTTDEPKDVSQAIKLVTRIFFLFYHVA